MAIVETSARLLRGILDYDDGKLTTETRAANYERLKASKFSFERDDDIKINRFIEEFYLEHLEVPTAFTIVEHFEDRSDPEVLERMKQIGRARPYDRAGYSHFLKRAIEERNSISASALLKEVQQILDTGKVVRDKGSKTDTTLKGVQDAYFYFNDHILDILPTEKNAKTIGDLRDDTDVAWQEYQTAKMNPGVAWGRAMGIQVVDETCHGCKKGELWVHAGAPGDGKTTLALNWAVNQVTHYKGHVLYVSLEMPFKQLRNLAYAIHTSHLRFKGRHAPLEYQKMRDGQLSPEEEAFFKEVLEDFRDNPKHCRFKVWQPDREVTIDDIKLHAELIHKRMELGLIIIDHSQLVEPRRYDRDYTIRLNSVIRDTKKLALHFNGGEGVAVCLLHQINRQGRAEAEKNDGVYKFSALSYANECLVGGTLVRTAEGLTPIEQVEMGSQVWSLSGWKTVKARMDNGVREVLQVQTFNGYEIRATPEHLFRTLTPQGKLEWVEASKLEGHYLLSDLTSAVGLSTTPSPLNLPPLTFEKGEKPKGGQGVSLVAPNTMTRDLAYLIGAYDGDGLLSDSYRVGWTGNRRELGVRHRIQSSFRNTFGHDLSLTEAPSRPGSFDLTKWSKPVKRWCSSIGMDRQPYVSPYVLNSGSDIHRYYLQGVWDTDGSINNQGILALSMETGKVALLRQIQLMMAGIGIPTTLRPGQNHLRGKVYGRHILWVTTQEGRAKFAELIGFSEPLKQKRLQRKVPSADKTVWPIGPFYLSLYDQYRRRGRGKGVTFHRTCSVAASQVRSGSLNVTHASLTRFLETLDRHGVIDEQAVFLRGLLANSRPQLVETVRPVGCELVYDLDVGGDHEFSAGGVLVHNCEKSADYITATFLDEERRANGSILLTNLKNRDNKPFPPTSLGIDFSCRRISSVDTSELNGMTVDEQDEVFETMSGL